MKFQNTFVVFDEIIKQNTTYKVFEKVCIRDIFISTMVFLFNTCFEIVELYQGDSIISNDGVLILYLFLLTAPTGHSIQLDFTRIETECSYDFVFVYDGDSYNSTKLASVSGDTLPKSFLAKSGHVCGVCYQFFCDNLSLSYKEDILHTY